MIPKTPDKSSKLTRFEVGSTSHRGLHIYGLSYWNKQKHCRDWRPLEPESIVRALQKLMEVCEYDHNCREYFAEELKLLGLP